MQPKEFYDLEIYQLSRKLSNCSWEVYKGLEKDLIYGIGQQLIRSSDSIGANIAEGFGRYHYYDKIRFYYNSRASLYEVLHWYQLMEERDIITKDKLYEINNIVKTLSVKLNNFIKSVRLKAGSDKQ